MKTLYINKKANNRVNEYTNSYGDHYRNLTTTNNPCESINKIGYFLTTKGIKSPNTIWYCKANDNTTYSDITKKVL